MFYVAADAAFSMPGKSPTRCLSKVVYHKIVKKYTFNCEAFFTEKMEKWLRLLVGFAIIAGIVWISMRREAIAA